IDVKHAGCVPPVQFVPPPPLLENDPLRPLLLARDGAELGERALLKRPELARTLEALGKRGPAAFYKGAVAQSIAATVQARGGIVGHFRGHGVWTAPAPAGGLTELETLQILDARPPLTALGRGSSAAEHVIAEALKHAFADRARSLGDPAFVKVLEEKLTSV